MFAGGRRRRKAGSVLLHSASAKLVDRAAELFPATAEHGEDAVDHLHRRVFFLALDVAVVHDVELRLGGGLLDGEAALFPELSKRATYWDAGIVRHVPTVRDPPRP